MWGESENSPCRRLHFSNPEHAQRSNADLLYAQVTEARQDPSSCQWVTKHFSNNNRWTVAENRMVALSRIRGSDWWCCITAYLKRTSSSTLNEQICYLKSAAQDLSWVSKADSVVLLLSMQLCNVLHITGLHYHPQYADTSRCKATGLNNLTFSILQGTSRIRAQFPWICIAIPKFFLKILIKMQPRL